jgi:predicted esterase
VSTWSAVSVAPGQLARGLVALAIGVGLFVHFAPRPAFLPLVARLDGPEPARASGLVVYLHGRGGGLWQGRTMVNRLREAGLPGNVAILLVEAPYSTGWGHHWGDNTETQAVARARLHALFDELGLGSGGPPTGWIVIAGFSQGAGVALDVAVEDSRIGAVASFSPCLSMLRGELPKREGLRVLLAHGSGDTVCPVEESRSLARVLDAAHRPARYIEFDGPHEVPPEVVRALVSFATAT